MTQHQYRWSGLAGIAGSVLFIFVFVWVGVVVGTDTSIAGFPSIRAGRTVENGLYLAVLILWVAPFLALHRSLCESSPSAAPYGSVLAIIGLGVLAAGALPHVASVPIADVYQAPGADRAALAAVWQGTQAILTMLLVTGLVVLPFGVVALGIAMLGSPTFGAGYGRIAVALGAVGVAVAGVLLVDPLSPVAALGFFALVAFHLAIGWRLYALSRSPAEEAGFASTVTGRSAG